MRLFPWKHVNHAWLDMSCFNVSINPAHVMRSSRYHVSMGTLSIFLNATSNLVSWPRCGRHHPYCVSMELLWMRFCIMLRQSKSSSTMEADIFPWLRLRCFHGNTTRHLHTKRLASITAWASHATSNHGISPLPWKHGLVAEVATLSGNEGHLAVSMETKLANVTWCVMLQSRHKPLIRPSHDLDTLAGNTA